MKLYNKLKNRIFGYDMQQLISFLKLLSLRRDRLSFLLFVGYLRQYFLGSKIAKFDPINISFMTLGSSQLKECIQIDKYKFYFCVHNYFV